VSRSFTLLVLAILLGVGEGFGTGRSIPADDRYYRELFRMAAESRIPLSELTNRPTMLNSEAEIELAARNRGNPALLKKLIRLFGREVSDDEAASWRLYQHRNGDAYFRLDPRFTFRIDAGDGKSYLRRGSGIQFEGGIRSFDYYFRFFDNTERGGGPYWARSQLFEDRYGYVGPLMGGRETYYDATEAWLAYRAGRIEVKFGKERISWGPGKGTNLLLSANAPSIDQLNLKVSLSENTRFNWLVGKLHPSNDSPLDSVYRTSDGWIRYASATKWIAAHRLETSPKEWLQIAVNEAVVWGERGLDASYLNPLYFLYSAQHDGGDRDNVLMSGDVTLKPRDGWLAYGELLIDDIKISSLGKGYIGNRIGWLFGVYSSEGPVDAVDFGIEYVRLEPFVYSHYFPINRFSTWTSSLGANLKPNSDRLSFEANYKLMNSLAFRYSGGYNRHGSFGGEIRESIPRIAPSKVRFLDGDRTKWFGWRGVVEYIVAPGALLEIGLARGEREYPLPDRWFASFGYRI